MIESNTLDNTGTRNTANPVTPIDLVAASGWTIRRNLISDFIKGGGNRVSYGAFAKGAAMPMYSSATGVVRAAPARRPGSGSGLSLGGGGTGAEFCRDGKCIVEQQGSSIRANLIAACSDVGIYLNSAAAAGRAQHPDRYGGIERALRDQ
jgi:hypothetical protein